MEAMTDPAYDSTATEGRSTPSHSVALDHVSGLGPELREGTWYYEGTGIEIPGAATRTVGEAADIKVVAQSDGTPLAALVPRTEIARLPDLAWVPSVGKLVRTEPDEFEVSWAEWQERANASVGVRAPEWDDGGLDRMLAVLERELRFARAAVDQRTGNRARTIAIAAGLGKSRRGISRIIGVTPVRVAQIIDDLGPIVALEVQDFLNETVAILRYISNRKVKATELTAAGHSDDVLSELLEMGLISQSGAHISLTAAGEQAELHLRTAAKQKSAS
jgi:hypothetical protein